MYFDICRFSKYSQDRSRPAGPFVSYPARQIRLASESTPKSANSLFLRT